MPAPDNLDRDKFYSSVDDDSDAEYELEPPDPEVLAAEERRAKEVVAATERSIDIDQIYRDAEHSRSTEILNDWVRNFRFQFQVKHLLVATAVLAILLALWQHEVLGKTLVMLAMAAVVGLYLYLQWKDEQHQAEAARRRTETYDRRRAAQAGVASSPTAVPARDAARSVLPPAHSMHDDVGATDRSTYAFQFSLKQLLFVMGAAAVVLGMVSFLGGPQNAAILLGVVALAGLVFHAVGYEPPPMVALGWWLLLLFYVLLSLFGFVWTAFG
jgi:hypothetical protein